MNKLSTLALAASCRFGIFGGRS